MARTTEEIIITMDAEQASQPDLIDLNSESSTSIYGLWKYIVAQCYNYLEQLWDAKQLAMENVLATGVPPSLTWLRSKAFDFQYGDNLELVDLVPQYAAIDEDKKIITRCSVSQSGGVVYIYAAKNEPPVKLTAPEKTALQDYYTASGDGTNQAVGIGYGGQVLSVISLDPDLLYIDAIVTYMGKYASTIQEDTNTAIEDYISTLGQNPIFRIVDLIKVLQDNVPGFVDIQIANMSARPFATAWVGVGTGTFIVQAGDILVTKYTAAAGYMTGETTATFTFTDDITFSAI
jgi:hypothetical protein